MYVVSFCKQFYPEKQNVLLKCDDFFFWLIFRINFYSLSPFYKECQSIQTLKTYIILYTSVWGKEYLLPCTWKLVCVCTNTHTHTQFLHNLIYEVIYYYLKWVNFIVEFLTPGVQEILCCVVVLGTKSFLR